MLISWFKLLELILKKLQDGPEFPKPAFIMTLTKEQFCDNITHFFRSFPHLFGGTKIHFIKEEENFEPEV